MQLHTYITGTTQTRAYRLLRQKVVEVLSGYELTPTYWAMLGIILESRDGIRQTDVAKQLQVKPPLVTMMTRELQNRGFIISVTNQFDARAKLLTTTPAGKKYIKMVESNLSKMLDTLLDGLTQDDMMTYQKVLTAIIVNGEK
ncbi:MAG: MarR family transcriptional regulator [Candidatus Saccharimonadales bacterium]